MYNVQLTINNYLSVKMRGWEVKNLFDCFPLKSDTNPDDLKFPWVRLPR